MSNRHERRKAAASCRKGLARLKTATLDQHLDDMLRRVRAAFARTGEIHSAFECVTDGEIFHVPANWPDRRAKAAACAALRDSFHRRGVNRYVFASEAWVGKNPGRFLPADDPDRGERVQVIAVERNGPRRYAFAEITRNGETAMLGPWEVNADVPRGWLFELLEDGHSDRAPKAEPQVKKMSTPDFQDLADQHPERAAEFQDSVQIHAQLADLLADEQTAANGDPMAMFLALESVLRSIVKDMGSPMGVGQFARFLRDLPDKFPMFSTVSDEVSSTRNFRSCKAILRRFSCEKRELFSLH